MLTLKIAGEMTIPYAEEIRTALLVALNAADRLTLDIEEVRSIDLTGLQLIFSTRHTAEALHKEIELNGTDNNEYRDMLRAAGFPCWVDCIRSVVN